MFKKWHVDNKVLEKPFHERQGHNKSVFTRETHWEKKNPKTALLKIIKVILSTTAILEK